jgi:5-dehydro-2-deoxygluconokinase
VQILWQTLRKNRFVALGRVGMDLYADPIGTPVQEAQMFRAAIGGSAGNIAVALARQGAEAALLSRVSPDAVGRYCRAELARFGVACDLVTDEAGEARTSLAITETVAEACQVVLYRNGAADFALDEADVARADFAGVGALIVTGTALAREPSRSAAWAALHKAQGARALVVLDVDYRAYSWASAIEARETCATFARACDIVIGNDDEFGLLSGAHDKGEAFARSLVSGRAIFSVYKRGAKGSTTYTDYYSFQTGIYPVAALKPMGAGDGFMGGLLAALAQGLPLETAIRRGAATAAIIVAGFGCAPASPTTSELDAFMAKHRETTCI